MDAPGQPRRTERASRRWRWCAASSTARIRSQLAARLWPLASLADDADELFGRIDAVEPTLADGRALPPAITLAAEVVRLLRAEPLLPPSLTPQPWPPDALRVRYRTFDRAIGRAMAAAVRQSGA